MGAGGHPPQTPSKVSLWPPLGLFTMLLVVIIGFTAVLHPKVLARMLLKPLGWFPKVFYWFVTEIGQELVVKVSEELNILDITPNFSVLCPRLRILRRTPPQRPVSLMAAMQLSPF